MVVMKMSQEDGIKLTEGYAELPDPEARPSTGIE
jgi:hypothetical protein